MPKIAIIDRPNTPRSVLPLKTRFFLRRARPIFRYAGTSNCTAHAPLKEKLCELKLLYGQYDVHTLCEALDVSRGTFYNHILRNKRSNAWFEGRREEYRILIRNVFDEYRQVLGADKICAVLVQRVHWVSREYVAKLMRKMGLSSIRTTAKQDYRKLHGEERKENVRQQQFHVDKFNRVRVSDVTCLKLGSHYFQNGMGTSLSKNRSHLSS